MAKKKKQEVAPDIKPAKKTPYRVLDDNEIDLLFAFFEKYQGNMSEMVLDKECQFHSYAQLHHYCITHGFKDKLVAIRLERAKEISGRLKDAKMIAIEQAMKILNSHHVFVTSKNGLQIFDEEGKPLIVERLPYYKEIKAAWEIIKVELGEPTTISKGDLTSGGEPIKITWQKK